MIEVPEQNSALSQRPLAVRHSLVLGLNESVGQRMLLPLHFSATSQAPTEARHSAPLGLSAINVLAGTIAAIQPSGDTAAWVADLGFIAVCPDLFWRIEPGIDITDKTEAEWKKAFLKVHREMEGRVGKELLEAIYKETGADPKER